jgi:hypothetical protein
MQVGRFSLKVWLHTVSLVITGFQSGSMLTLIPFLSVCILWICGAVDVLVTFPASVFQGKREKSGCLYRFFSNRPTDTGGGGADALNGPSRTMDTKTSL